MNEFTNKAEYCHDCAYEKTPMDCYVSLYKNYHTPYCGYFKLSKNYVSILDIKTGKTKHE